VLKLIAVHHAEAVFVCPSILLIPKETEPISYIFICTLFNDAFCVSQNIPSIEIIIS
jgi:hypothetical protein